MAKIKITITAENAQAIKALQQVAQAAKQAGGSVNGAGSGAGAGFANATKSAGGFLGTLARVNVAAAGIIYVLRQIKDTAAAAFGPGFNYTKNMEINRLGMAGILQSMTLIDGKAVDFGQALAISSDMMRKLQQDALKTAASTEDLVEVFRAILAPGLNAGMTLDQIRQITVVGTNAIKALGIPRQQIVQELRDLVQGGITAAGSTLATALGLTDADIKKAKDSSEGLFKFLMDRMAGFAETSERFPDTIAGTMDQLDETWTMASAKFTEEFEEPIKEGLRLVVDLIGTVNTKTGEFEVNPALIAFIKEIKTGLQEIKDLANDIGPSFSWVRDVTANMGKLGETIKSLASIIGDDLRIKVNFINKELIAPTVGFFSYLSSGILNDVNRVLRLAANSYDQEARRLGVKSVGKAPSAADLRRSEDSNTLPDFNVTPKYPDANKAIEQSQTAMKIALAAIAADAKKAAAEIKAEQNSIEVLYKQSMLSAEEYARRKTELERKLQLVSVDEAQRKLEAIQSAQYDKDADKQTAIAKANEELKVEVDKLKEFGLNLDDVTKAIAAMSGAGHSWRKEVETVDIDGLQDNAKSAIDALGAYFQKLTGRQMVVSSGLRDWGGHVSGTKFDVVDDATSELLEKNVDGIRDKIIAYAESIGLQVLDEYEHPSEQATGGHLDINAKDFTATLAAQAKAQIGQVLTKSGLEYLNSILELMGEADEIMQALAEAKGNVSSRQKAALSAKYSDLIEKFQVNGMDAAVKAVEDLQKAEFLKFDFAQAQQDLDQANGQLVTIQEDLINELAAGSKTAAEATDEYVTQYKAKTDKIVIELRRIIVDADANGQFGLSNSAKALLRQIVKSVNAFADDVIARIDAELQHELAMINADRSLTDLQRQDRIDEVTRRKAGQRAAEYERQAQEAYRNDDWDIAKKAEELAILNRKLAETPTLLDDVRQAGKQGLEDGLLEFLERGIIECRTLGEAFRNLANSILQSIQRVYAEALTKNIMEALGLSGGGTSGSSEFKYKSPGVVLPGGGIIKLAEGGSMDSGEVKGPGTSTSDSILAWAQNIKKWIRVSDGEWVVRGAAVKKYGTAFLERLNSGKVPISMIQQYATGGSLTDRSFSGNLPGPQELSANLSNSTTIPLSIMNVLDPSLMDRYVRTREGKRAIVNLIKDDATLIKRILDR